MANQHIQPDDLWPSAQYGFSQVVVSTGTKIIHCAGQTAWDKDMNLVGGDDLEQQTAQALENIKSALAAAGATCRTWWPWMSTSWTTTVTRYPLSARP